ncbi:MAG TPA: cyclic nucleotide-binding domain-containing protein [Gaiellaceae bacterium]|nr:cyclic nucleotide-binding domain-containing protein [Gaiellaceae bacterium]HSJ93575.1 cyclic nucleotide-binding domain-containing protein [Gaiellaceae bacterium]
MARAPIDVLRRVALFEGLDEDELTRLADRFQERSVPAGQTVVEEGSTGTSFFVIADGEATVSIGGEEKATFGPGDSFGEMSVIDEDVRSASVVATKDLHLFFLTPWEFRPFVREQPEVAWKLLQALSRRLRAAQQRG